MPSITVDTNRKNTVIQDPLNINFGRPGYSGYIICDFYNIVKRIEETLVINKYKIRHFTG